MSCGRMLAAFIFLILVNLSAIASGRTRLHQCINGGNYTSNNGSYRANLNAVLSSLSTNIDSNGFYNASTGHNPDRANAIVLCRGDVGLDACRECVQYATVDLPNLCPYRKQAIIWNELCMLNISVPVNRTQASTMIMRASPTLLQSTLRSGFWIQWSANNGNCDNCERSGGYCGQDRDSGSFACYCADRAYPLTCNNTQTGNGNGSRKGLSNLQKSVIKGVTLGVAGIFVSSLIIFYITKKCRLRRPDQKSNQKVNEFLLNNGSLAPKRYSYNEIKKITKSFTDKLGQGGFGIVYKGKLPDGQLVAVKVLTETNDNGEEFINEVASISRTSHVNIVKLSGVSRRMGKVAQDCSWRCQRS